MLKDNDHAKARAWKVRPGSIALEKGIWERACALRTQNLMDLYDVRL
jgi:hypothetical protein